MNKYRNIQTAIDGHVFDSKAEAERYLELKMLLKAKKIKNLRIHPVYELQDGFVDRQGKKHRPITYIADFDYYDLEKKLWVTEDVKGMKTEVYRIKKKLFLYLYRYLFKEVS